MHTAELIFDTPQTSPWSPPALPSLREVDTLALDVETDGLR